jgi:hypothetical protein
MAAEMPHDVFVSYSSKDKPTADALVAMVERNGIRCWVAPRDILPGAEWGASIVEAINGSRVLVLVFSAFANDSPQIKREVERAVNREIPIIPFRIEQVAPSGTLEYFISTPHWLDAFSGPLDQHLQQLVATLRGLVGGEGRAPPEAAAVVPPAPPAPVARSRSWGTMAFTVGLAVLAGGAVGAGLVLMKRSPAPSVVARQSAPEPAAVPAPPQASPATQNPAPQNPAPQNAAPQNAAPLSPPETVLPASKPVPPPPKTEPAPAKAAAVPEPTAKPAPPPAQQVAAAKPPPPAHAASPLGIWQINGSLQRHDGADVTVTRRFTISAPNVAVVHQVTTLVRASGVLAGCIGQAAGSGTVSFDQHYTFALNPQGTELTLTPAGETTLDKITPACWRFRLPPIPKLRLSWNGSVLRNEEGEEFVRLK